MIRPEVGSQKVFIAKLQEKLDEKLDGNPPDTRLIEL
jgi:hypothetical protein